MEQKVEYIKIKDVLVPMIFEKDKSLPIISIQLIFRQAGSVEDFNKFGLSKLASKILGEGTKTLGSIKFANELESRAISLSVSSQAESFMIEISILKEYLDYAKTALINLLKDPNLTKETLQKNILITKGIILNNANNFDYVASSNLNKTLYKNTPLEHDSIGENDSLDSIKLEDIQDFLDKHIDVSNSIFVIGGDISEKEACKFAADVLEVLPKNEKRNINFYDTLDTCENNIIVKNTEQAYIYFGSPLFLKINSNDLYKAKIAGFIFGEGGFGSRLMEEIRVKRGLAYSAYARYSPSLINSSFKGYLQTKNESCDEAVAIIKDILADFIENGVSKDELEKAKKFILGSEPLRAETLSKRLSRSYMEFCKDGKVGSYKKELELIESLKLDDLNNFIKSHDEVMKLSFSILKNG